MSNVLAVYNSETTEALTWLRNVLTAIVKVAPLSYLQKKKTARLVNRIPDWLLASWAQALNIDFLGWCNMYPFMAEGASKPASKQAIGQYLEAHDVVAAGNCFEDLSRDVRKCAREGKLPAEGEVVARQVCALAWADLTSDGVEFTNQASMFLSRATEPNHVAVDYQQALNRGDVGRISDVESILAGSKYGEWVDCRLDEAKRYLGIDTPVFEIHFGERTPQWEAFWGNIIKGGIGD